MSVDPFNPAAVAKEVIGQLTNAIKATGRDPSVPEPPDSTTFNTALLLQAGFRALLPVRARSDVAAPKVFPSDPEWLRNAQRNCAEVLRGRRKVTPEQELAAWEAISLAAAQLAEQGYGKVSAAINQLLGKKESHRPRAVGVARPPGNDGPGG